MTPDLKFPRQEKGGNPQLIRRVIANRVLDAVEAFLNLRITVPMTDGLSTLSPQQAKVDISGGKCEITMPPMLLPGYSPGGFVDFYDNTKAYAPNSIVQVQSSTTISGVSVQAGTYALRQGLSVEASATGNKIPQWPYPGSGTTYWILIAFYPVSKNGCDNTGAVVTEYINASS